MRAQHADVTIDGDRRFRPREHEGTPSMRQPHAASVNPLPAAVLHGGADALDTDSTVMVATDCQHRRSLLDVANEFAQLRQLVAMVRQIAPQQHHIRIRASDGIEDLPAESVGTPLSEVNVADVEQSTRVVPRRESLLADVQGSPQADVEPSKPVHGDTL
jgi:hypothetical protein